MERFFIYSLIISLGGGGILGCKKKEKEAASLPPRSPSRQSPGKDVIATVNGVDITRPEVTAEMHNLLRQYGDRLLPEQLNQVQPQLWKQAVENLIGMSLLLQEAERRGIQPAQEAIDRRIDKVSGRFPTPESFQEHLETSGVSRNEFIEGVVRHLKIEAMVESLAPPVEEPGEEEVAAYYRDHSDSFRVPERVRVSHILLTLGTEEDSEDRERKRQKLSLIKKEIEEGLDFAQLAFEHSQDPESWEEGGDLGYFGRGMMIKPLEDAAFGMETGAVSEVVETEFGYHLITVTDRQEAGTLPLAEVRDKVVTFLNNQKRAAAVGDYMRKLRSSATIEYAEGFEP